MASSWYARAPGALAALLLIAAAFCGPVARGQDAPADAPVGFDPAVRRDFSEPVTLSSSGGVLEVRLIARQGRVRLDTVAAPVDNFLVFAYELIRGTSSNGQMSGRDLKSGTILTARLIDPTILVKSGQLVSITLTQGAISAKSVARATEQGTIGQTIRVKNEVTNNTFDVVVTGPQTAKLPPSGTAAEPGVAALDR